MARATRQPALDAPRGRSGMLQRTPQQSSDRFGRFSEAFARAMGTSGFLIGMTIFVIYCIIFTFNVARGSAGLEDLQQHMWGFAGAVLVLTLFMLGRVLYMKTLSLSGGITSLAGWGIFLLCAWISLQDRGIQLMSQAHELLAFNTALLMLPFTLFLLTAWSYDRLRHC